MALVRDAAWQDDVQREIVGVLAEREKYSLAANLIAWSFFVATAALIGLTPLLVLALGMRLVAMTTTRLACNALRAALRDRRPFQRPFLMAQISLSFAAVSWAMMTWPLFDGTPFGAAELAMLALVTAGLIAICSLAGLSRFALFGFASLFVGSVVLGSVIMTGAIDWAVCAAIACPIAGAVPFGLGTGRQALQTAENTVDKRCLSVELERSLDHAEFLSRHDPLTGLLNRRALFADAEPAPRDRTVIALDLDRFKAVNDMFGHQVGDRVLVTVGRILRDAAHALAPHNCRVGRLGGEEFALVLDGKDGAATAAFAEALRARIAAAFPLEDVPGLFVTASLGVAPWPGGTALDSALAEADRHLYRAKEAGRNRVASLVAPDAEMRAA